jgi:AcrR family transcriptional regulator
MPKLKPDTQRARRARILDAAEQCFVRSGFHRTTMHDICKEAGISPGALYLYFDSKEALIEGLSERDRAEFADRFVMLSSAPDFLEALKALGEQYFVEEPASKRVLCIEIGLESTRNARIAAIFRNVDDFVTRSFADLFQRLKDEGRIAPVLDIPSLAEVFAVMGDGLFWRRAVVPQFDSKAVVATVLAVLRGLLNPQQIPVGGEAGAAATPHAAHAALTRQV